MTNPNTGPEALDFFGALQNKAIFAASIEVYGEPVVFELVTLAAAIVQDDVLQAHLPVVVYQMNRLAIDHATRRLRAALGLDKTEFSSLLASLLTVATKCAQDHRSAAGSGSGSGEQR